MRASEVIVNDYSGNCEVYFTSVNLKQTLISGDVEKTRLV